MKLFKQIEIPKKEIIIPCDCGADAYAHFLVFERTTDEKDYEIDELYVTTGGHKIWNLKEKLKIAWEIFKDGEFRNYGVLCHRKDIKKLKKYLEEVLSYWEKLEKEDKNDKTDQ